MDSIDVCEGEVPSNKGLPPARRFEDLLVWQKARILSKSVYQITRTKPFAKDFGLTSQAQRASASVMANIAEGFDRRGPGEFAHFLSIAKGSCAELRSHLYIALDSDYVTETEFSQLKAQAEQVSRFLHNLMSSLKKPTTKR